MLRRLALVACLALVTAYLPFASSASPAGMTRPHAPSQGSRLLANDDFPAVDPDYIYGQLAYLATHFLRREAGYDTNLPPGTNGHDEFADYWSQELLHSLEGFGAQTRRDPFRIEGWTGLPPPVPAFNVEVTVPGAVRPEQIVLVGCHYDGEHDSTQSAYDDASGCAIELGVAKAMAASWRTRGVYPARTLRFVLFDGEEQGLRGSYHYLNETTNGDLSNIVAMFNEEQSGISYPLRFLGKVSNPLLSLNVQLAPLADNDFYPEQSRLTPAQRDHLARFRMLAQDALPAVFLRFQMLGYLWLSYRDDAGLPTLRPIFTPQQMGRVLYVDDVLGGSDQVPFTEAGVPCITLSGNNTYYDPAPSPWSYPFDQPEDSIQLMNTYASGGTGKAASLVLALALPGMLTTWLLAQPEVLGAVQGDGKPLAAIGSIGQTRVGASLRFDAAASFDPSHGPLSYTWDFGDGASATGPSVSHTYARAGGYTLSLTVTSPTGARQVTKRLAVTSRPTTYFNRYSLRGHSGSPPRNPAVRLPVPHDTPTPTSAPNPSQRSASGTAAPIREAGPGGGIVIAVLLGLGLVGLGAVGSGWLWLRRRRRALSQHMLPELEEA